MIRRSTICLLLSCLLRFAVAQDSSQSSPSLQTIDLQLTVDEGRLLAKQLSELEFRRAEVFSLLKQIEDMKAKNIDLVAEVEKQLGLERQAHDYTRTQLKQAEDRAAFYKSAYDDLKVPPKTPWLTRKAKVAIIVGVIAAGAVTVYAVSR